MGHFLLLSMKPSCFCGSRTLLKPLRRPSTISQLSCEQRWFKRDNTVDADITRHFCACMQIRIAGRFYNMNWMSHPLKSQGQSQKNNLCCWCCLDGRPLFITVRGRLFYLWGVSVFSPLRSGVQLGATGYCHLMVPFIKLAYPSNLTLHNNHFMTEIRTLKSKSPANTEIKVIFHHRLIQIALSCTSVSENSRKAA